RLYCSARVLNCFSPGPGRKAGCWPSGFRASQAYSSSNDVRHESNHSFGYGRGHFLPHQILSKKPHRKSSRFKNETDRVVEDHTRIFDIRDTGYCPRDQEPLALGANRSAPRNAEIHQSVCERLLIYSNTLCSVDFLVIVSTPSLWHV